MRPATRTSALAASALLLAACSTSPGTTSSPTGSAPETSTTTTEPNGTPSGSPSEPTADVPPDVLLPTAAWEAPGEQRTEDEGVDAWHLPDACATEFPADAAAMRTLTQGDGAAERPVGVHQVAVFDGVDAAVAAADDLQAAITACAGTTPDESAGGTTYVAEPLEVGAQGAGLATDHYGASQSGGLDDALGTYLASTRRGTSVTLVALEGGESTVGAARQAVVAHAQAAWELLCRYDSEGC